MQGAPSSLDGEPGVRSARSKRSCHAYHFAAAPEPAPRKRIGSVLARPARPRLHRAMLFPDAVDRLKVDHSVLCMFGSVSMKCNWRPWA